MDATIKIKITPRNWIPTRERAAWLERFGPQPEHGELTITAPLGLWERAGAAIDVDPPLFSSILPTLWQLEEMVEEHFVATGQILALGVEHLEHLIAIREDAAAKEAAMAEARAEEKETARKRAMEVEVDLLDTVGTPSQRDRHAAGVLPEAELLTLARDILFSPLDRFPRFRRLGSKDVIHGEDCVSKGDSDRETFGTSTDEIELSAEEFARLQEIKEITERRTVGAVPKATIVTIRRHYGVCDNERCPDVAARHGILVTIAWAGRDLSREYAATGDLLP